MHHICFVTNEMYPVKAGGIGRLMYQFALQARNSPSQTRVHFLLSASEQKDVDVIRNSYADLAEIHICDAQSCRNDLLGYMLTQGPRRQANGYASYRQSVEYYLGLRAVEDRLGIRFDSIEFPDFGGWAAASIAAKQAGMAFERTRLAIRLHSTLGLITRYEKYSHYPSADLGFLLDLEGWCLARADLVVGHLDRIADRNAEHYGLSDSWRDAVHIEFPPVIHETMRAEPHAPAGPGVVESPSDFLFSSRYQPFKRPDLYIFAAVEFLHRHADYQGRFILAAYGWDRDYIEWLKGLIPAGLVDRISFREDVSAEVRERLVRDSIVVIPSDYESLCVFAYEASLAGARVILNGACEAFLDDVRWRHNENCLKFDGTVDGLVKTMESALDWSPGSVPDMTVDPPYWTKPANCVPAVAEAVADRRVSIVVTGCVSPEAVNESVTALSRAIAEHDDVCFLLPSSGFDQDDNSCRLIRRHGWNFRLLAGDARNPEQIQASLLDQQSDIIVLLPAAYRLHPRFTQSARLAMSRNDKLAIFTTHVREMVGSPGTPVGVRVYAGDLASAAMSLDCIVPGAVVFRRSVFNDYAFDLRAREAWFDEFTRRLCLAGEEVLVAPCVQLDLQGSKVEQTNPQLLSAALADEYVRTLGGHVRMLAFDGKQGPSQSEAASNSASRQIDPDALRLAWPEEKDSRQSVLVGESAGASGLPITLAEATVLCASLGNCYEGGRLILDISAAEDGNAAEVAVAAMAHIPDSTGLQSLLTDAIHDDIALTGWRLVESGQRMSIELAVPPLEGDHGVVILMFRPASGAVAVSTRVFIAGMSLEPLQYG